MTVGVVTLHLGRGTVIVDILVLDVTVMVTLVGFWMTAVAVVIRYPFRF